MCVKCDESEKDCRQIRKKKFNVGTVVMEIPKGDYIPKGLVLKRELTIREVTRLYENGKHKTTILGCEDLSAYHNAK